MTINSFIKLVEIQTKVASIIPFLIGTLYVLYRFNTFKVNNFFLMLLSLLCVDMATTAINNYLDYKKANKKEGYGYESHNAIVKDNIKESTVLMTICILLLLATIFGVILFINTNIIVLILGGISFVVGIFYSFGPIPISRTPFGEFFSGVFMGFIIPFISIYIHIYDGNIINLTFQNREILTLEVNLLEIVFILLLSIPSIVGIANIMLANNICDLEDDMENKRFTLPLYIGKENALKLYRCLYYIGYFAIILLLILRAIPVVAIISLVTILIVNKNVRIFTKRQSKKETFIYSVKNFIIINIVLVLSLVISLF